MSRSLSWKRISPCLMMRFFSVDLNSVSPAGYWAIMSYSCLAGTIAYPSSCPETGTVETNAIWRNGATALDFVRTSRVSSITVSRTDFWACTPLFCVKAIASRISSANVFASMSNFIFVSPFSVFSHGSTAGSARQSEKAFGQSERENDASTSASTASSRRGKKSRPVRFSTSSTETA